MSWYVAVATPARVRCGTSKLERRCSWLETGCSASKSHGCAASCAGTPLVTRFSAAGAVPPEDWWATALSGRQMSPIGAMLGSDAANSPRRCAALVSSVAARFHLQHDLRNIAVLSARVENRRGQRKTGVSVRQLRSGSRRASAADRSQQDRALRRQMLERRHRPYPSRGHCPQPDSIVPLFSGVSKRQASAADRCQQDRIYGS